MMIAACMVLLAAGVPVIAQEGVPGLEVSDIQSRYIPGWSSRRGVVRDPKASDLSSRPASFELSAVFRNTGSKVITFIFWECLFFRDAQRTDVMLRHKFRDGKRIAPGEESRLKHASATGAATEHKAVRITRVVYADGTVWQASKAGTETRN
jgi:hypothetical protein